MWYQSVRSQSSVSGRLESQYTLRLTFLPEASVSVSRSRWVAAGPLTDAGRVSTVLWAPSPATRTPVTVRS